MWEWLRGAVPWLASGGFTVLGVWVGQSEQRRAERRRDALAHGDLVRTKIMDYLGALRDQIVFMRTIQSLVEGGLDLGAWEELDNPMLSPGRRFLSEAERVYLSFEALHKAALELSLLVDEGEFQKELELQAQRQAGRPLKRNEHEFETPQFMEEMAEEYEHIHAMARAYLRRKRR